MGRNRNRRSIARNISQDDRGYEIRVMFGGLTDSQRFALSTPMGELTAARNRMLIALETAAEKGTAASAKPGTMGRDAKRYLAAWSVKDQNGLTRKVMLWVDALGANTARRKVTADRVGQIVKGWATKPQPSTGAPYAPEYIAKLLKTLKHLYAYLDGGFHPFKQVKAPKPEQLEARAIPIHIADAILDGMRPSRGRAELKLMLALGITPAEIARLESTDIDWVAGTIAISAREKGEGAAPRLLPFARLTRAVAAVNEYAALDVWGTYPGDLWTMMQVAAARAGYADRGYRPYDLRHTCGTELYKVFKDLGTVADWLGHTTTKHTKRYTLGAVKNNLAAAADALNDAEAARARATEAARFQQRTA